MARSAVRRTRPAIVKARPPSRFTRLLLGGRALWFRGLEIYPLWVLIFLAVGVWFLVPSGAARVRVPEVGSIARRDFVAARDLLVPDQEGSEERRERAREAVLPVYDFDSVLAVERQRQVARLFAAGRELLGAADSGEPAREREAAGVLEALGEASGLRLTEELARLLVADGFSEALEQRLSELFGETLRRGVVGDKRELLTHRVRGIALRNLEDGSETVEFDLYDPLAYPEELEELLRRELRSTVVEEQRSPLLDLLLANLTPNLHPNRGETLARSRAAAEVAGTVYNQIRKGQMIVRQGDKITAPAALAITAMAGERRGRSLLLPVLRYFLMLALVALVLWLGLKKVRVADKSRRRVFAEVLLLLLAALAFCRFGFFAASALSGSIDTPPFDSMRSYVYAIPFASVALVAELLYGRVAALLLALLLSVLVGEIAGPGAAWTMLYCAAGSLAGMYSLDRLQFKQRSVMILAGLKICSVNAVVVLLLATSASDEPLGVAQLGFDIVCGLIGGLLAAAVASFAIPILESLLSITTDIKLVELANTNLPLLRRLALEAPGTFQHSLMVANLAKAGCDAIGADSVLAYTGALYHDVGKVFRPEYFIENQRPGRNPHDKLSAPMSTLVLINHIKEGLELARQHHLPKPICDAIEQHHGTRLITYFYNRAVAQRDPRTEEVVLERYRYPGPRPQNRVMGVLMLADAVEAASRTLVDVTPTKIRTLIRKIFDNCLGDGQLDQSDLTLADIKNVSESFFKLLSNLFHRRVDYPGFDFNATAGQSSSVERASLQVS